MLEEIEHSFQLVLTLMLSEAYVYFSIVTISYFI